MFTGESYSTGSGTVDVIGISVLGTGTMFLRELVIGNAFIVDDEIKRVLSIEDDTHLTLNEALVSDVGNQQYQFLTNYG